MFGRDKILHFIVGLIVAFVIGLYDAFIGLGVAILIGIMKEYVKDNGLLLRAFPSAPNWLAAPGTVDWRDLASTALGGYIGAMVSLAFM